MKKHDSWIHCPRNSHTQTHDAQNDGEAQWNKSGSLHSPVIEDIKQYLLRLFNNKLLSIDNISHLSFKKYSKKGENKHRA